jgi:anaerobic selenocysteine-containing dehydrogenase
MFMTPTASLADIVLPVASYLEYDHVVAPTNVIAQVQQKVAQVGECRSDYEIISGLARRLGLGEYFWGTAEEALDAILKPAGLTFREFREIGILTASKQYKKYERSGFGTPSGKVELYSSQLKEWGFDPLPTYYEPPESPYSAPGLEGEYPLILTNHKSSMFQHSGGRQITTLRSKRLHPTVEIHAELAARLGIAEGDWVYIETRRGRIRQKASLSSGIDPRVVIADYGWWFPEGGKPDLYGWSESNINLLTDNKPPYNREIGSPTLRGILCKVYKA